MNIEMVTKPADINKLMGPTPSGGTIDPNTGVEAGAPIEEILARIEADKMTKKAPAVVEMENSPLKLRYQWAGIDEKGHSVRTLMVDTESGSYCIAYCISCDKEIKSVKVAKLPEIEVESGSKVITKEK